MTRHIIKRAVEAPIGEESAALRLPDAPNGFVWYGAQSDHNLDVEIVDRRVDDNPDNLKPFAILRGHRTGRHYAELKCVNPITPSRPEMRVGIDMMCYHPILAPAA